MEEEINQTLFEITNPLLESYRSFLLNKYKKEFFDFPAAKRNHHAFASGLAYHTTTMFANRKIFWSKSIRKSMHRFCMQELSCMI